MPLPSQSISLAIFDKYEQPDRMSYYDIILVCKSLTGIHIINRLLHSTWAGSPFGASEWRYGNSILIWYHI